MEIKNIDKYVYLGDTIRSDGSSRDKIKQRLNKGQGIMRDIIRILEGLHLGPFFLEALKQLRDSMLISVITHNLEVSSNLTNSDVKALDDLDLSLIRKAMFLSSKASRNLIYLETGILSVEYIMKKKRITYFHSLMNTNSNGSSLSKQELLGQIKNPKVGDWYKLVEEDLKDIKIDENPSEIANLTRESLRKKVRESCSESFFNTLKEKQRVLSKGSEIQYTRFEMQGYLKAENKLNKELQQNMMKLRICDVYIKANFPMAFKDKQCSASVLCLHEETQKHIYFPVIFCQLKIKFVQRT